MIDRQLSGDFWLHEFPCWERATEADVAQLEESVPRVLQPVRNQFGPVYPTSWKWWRAGCTPRTGAHRHGALDFEVSGGQTKDAWEWGNTHLLPSGYIGRWIYEPETATQGEHIHMAPRSAMLAHNGDGRIQSLLERPDGSYWLAMDLTEGSYANPYELPGITAVAEAGIPWWLYLGLLFGLITADLSFQAAGGWQFKS